MAWISVHEQMRDHKKLRRLARLLNCNRHEAAGILIFLWLWALTNADREGAIATADNADISEGCGYEGEPDDLMFALTESGWLYKDEDGYWINDWDEWQGIYYQSLEKRKENARRMREYRRMTKTKEPKREARIEPKKTELVPAEAIDCFERLWALYPNKQGKSAVKPSTKKTMLKYGEERITKAIERYKVHLEDNPWKQAMNGSTFFNGRYEDYDTEEIVARPVLNLEDM